MFIVWIKNYKLVNRYLRSVKECTGEITLFEYKEQPTRVWFVLIETIIMSMAYRVQGVIRVIYHGILDLSKAMNVLVLLWWIFYFFFISSPFVDVNILESLSFLGFWLQIILINYNKVIRLVPNKNRRVNIYCTFSIFFSIWHNMEKGWQPLPLQCPKCILSITRYRYSKVETFYTVELNLKVLFLLLISLIKYTNIKLVYLINVNIM